MNKLKLSAIAVSVAAALGAVTPAHAVLTRVGPVSAANGYPLWYQDATGITLEFCNPTAAELADAWCLVGPEVNAPETFPTNFVDEHFYFSAASDIALPGAKRAILDLAVEAAFTGAVEPGGQIVFGRVRFRIDDLPETGVYHFDTPYGSFDVEGTAGGRIFETQDIGIGGCAAGGFNCALDSAVGPFLLPSAVPGGAELATPVVSPSGRRHIADPLRSGPVTGGWNGNVFRIVLPSGGIFESSDFSLVGRLWEQGIPGKVTVQRAAHTLDNSQQGGSSRVDVLVKGEPSTSGRFPGQAIPPAVAPTLSVFAAACVENTVNGEPVLSAPVGVPERLMVSAGTSYWNQIPLAGNPPSSVCVKDSASGTGGGTPAPSFFNAAVTDHVVVSSAEYDPSNGGKLTVRADSSIKDNAPELRLLGFGADPQGAPLVGGTIEISPMAAPPNSVSVRSARNGVGEAPVVIQSSTTPPAAIVNDQFTLNEDSGANTLDVAANDTGVNRATVTIVAPPTKGTASVDANGNIVYAPTANANGPDTLTYTALDTNGVQMDVATVSISVTPVNDVPVANADTASAAANVTLNIPVLANDTDPDTNPGLRIDSISAVAPAGPTVNIVNGGSNPDTVSFLGAVPGVYTFTYTARDAGNAVSNPATVTVTVSPAEVLNVPTALFRTVQSRWIVSGTSSIFGGQTVVVYRNNGTSTGAAGGVACAAAPAAPTPDCLLGTAVVDALGNFTWDEPGSTKVPGPLPAQPFTTTRIRVESPLGGSTTQAVTQRR